MMSSDLSSALHRLRDGETDAWDRLDRSLRSCLLGYVRSRRNPLLRNKIDSEGLVNSVLKSVLPGIAADQFPEVIDSKTLKDLLFNLVRSALRAERRHWHADKRNPEREVPSDGGSPEQIPQRSLSRPEYTVEIDDFVQRLYREVAELGDDAISVWQGMLNGLTRNEIAEDTGLTAGQVAHLTRHIQSRCRAILKAEIGDELFFD